MALSFLLLCIREDLCRWRDQLKYEISLCCEYFWSSMKMVGRLIWMQSTYHSSCSDTFLRSFFLPHICKPIFIDVNHCFMQIYLRGESKSGVTYRECIVSKIFFILFRSCVFYAKGDFVFFFWAEYRTNIFAIVALTPSIPWDKSRIIFLPGLLPKSKCRTPLFPIYPRISSRMNLFVVSILSCPRISF